MSFKVLSSSIIHLTRSDVEERDKDKNIGKIIHLQEASALHGNRRETAVCNKHE